MKARAPVAKISAAARYLPDHVMTNADLEKMVDTSDSWIRERTGISERRIAAEGESTTGMGARAANRALAKAGLEPSDVDLIIVTTATPDRWLPSTACEVQSRIGASRSSLAFDLHAACTGFLYAVSMAEGYVAAGRGEVVLVVSSEKMSSILNWDDRGTCVLFGDGAGAVVVQPSENGEGILSSFHRSDGDMADLLQRPAGGAARPLDEEVLREKEHLMQMSGREVFKSAVRSMAKAGRTVLREVGLTADQVDLMVPHQANIRIIESTARYSRIPMEKVFVNLNRYGNISSATIPVGLDEAEEEGRIEPGSLVLMTSFGAGLTWGAMAMRW
ncbi:MAG: ketoacyl-ACP synthase III [Gemmatimonadetes bacterium]|nr:ketoacyl-ACP synthase III [Gemmatimonadota bacterium]MYB98782.1 ketoacyl-ACP synthase III [Gemmatimonadota bacterium]MYH52868.1 ketoacyl-ACP synthase III [Gemmatimonadota bacterium]MYI46792.1 ketoacyl-ACP synthase III [Gemmatimonadota bacterium]MYK65162.1 ketoacyl-ACP synthase III [Gemmatimonadota bacterium]